VREVIATCDSDGVAEADGSLMFPEVLRPAPGEGISGSRHSTSGVSRWFGVQGLFLNWVNYK
jgi:hypothetical protein